MNQPCGPLPHTGPQLHHFWHSIAFSGSDSPARYKIKKKLGLLCAFCHCPWLPHIPANFSLGTYLDSASVEDTHSKCTVNSLPLNRTQVQKCLQDQKQQGIKNYSWIRLYLIDCFHVTVSGLWFEQHPPQDQGWLIVDINKKYQYKT